MAAGRGAPARPWLRRTLRLAALLLIACAVLVAVRLWPRAPLSARLPSSTAVLDARGHLLRLTLASDGQYRMWTPLRQISPQLVQAVLLHEDRHFWWEPGFNPVSLLRGAWVTYVLRRHPQGGSTLTMQLARLLWHMDTRTPWGKLKQIARAVQLEACYSRREILEAYLNYAPFGGNVQGVGAASLIYFDLPPAAVSLPEALTLAVLPQNPSGRGIIDHGLANPSLIAARDALYRRWVAQHPLARREAALFRLPLVMRSTQQLPFRAPWFVDQLLAQRSDSGRDNTWLRTSLDLGLQRVLMRQVQMFAQQRRQQGIDNAAALLVDTRDMGIKAMVGSADYFSRSIDGQVNGTDAKRSPGSALKPFIYGLAFDQGEITPATVLRDVPTAFGAYAPENFDERFLGPVTAEDALIRSRNIPAVDIAARLSHPSFYDFLRVAGISDLAPEQHYGLALVLGGGDVTMQEMAKLYALLANRGVLHRLRWRADARLGQGTPMLSAAASYMVLNVLQHNPPPEGASVGQPARLPVAWKTGTSSAFRDAWSAGVFGPYVLVVWVGNFDGRSNPALVGGEAAAPLFFNIVHALEAMRPALRVYPPQPVPARLRRVSICLSSGALPTVWCPRRGETWFIPGVSPIKVDTVYRPVMIDTRSGKAACPPYDPRYDKQQVFEFWPTDLQQVFRAAGIPRRAPPQNPACPYAEAVAGQAPRITSPLLGAVYSLRVGQRMQSEIALSATADADARALYWFADRNYIGRSLPGRALFWRPRVAGDYTLRVVDDHGRADVRALRVALVH